VSENLPAVLDERDGASNGGATTQGGPYRTHVFTFDYVYDQYATQRKVYETTARPVVDSALQGYNATIFAYGQTGTGKTYTMEGFNIEGNVEERGIIPRAIEQIFGHIQTHASPTMRFLVRASYLQIYNEQISDLLKPERNNLTIREDKRRGVYVESLSEWVVRSPAEIYGLMERGGAMRATGSTKMNEISSRSHAVFIIIAEQSETVYVQEDGRECSMEDFSKMMHAAGISRAEAIARLENHVRQSFKVGKLNLVDLAGSERVRLSGATGQRLEESKKINQSLSALGNVISALTDTRGRKHIPYRDSKLTRILEDSLGGNCKTTMMAMISPALESMVESVSTLKFANRAKNIRNEPVVNEDLDQKSLLRKYERELKRLRAELEERNRSVVDQRRLLELEEQRKRAEADKMAAIRALEARSLEFMREKEAKRHLEERIATLMGQMIRGDSNAVKDLINRGADLGAIIKQHNDRLQEHYEHKLASLERERESIEEEKQQVDRYKHLLLKQRDIMIALTQRLNERDEQIMALQEELDAYDRHQRELEEKLDEKHFALIHLQRVAMEHQASSPDKSANLTRALGDWSEMAAAEGAAAAAAASAAANGSEKSATPAMVGASGAELSTLRTENQALRAQLQTLQTEMDAEAPRRENIEAEIANRMRDYLNVPDQEQQATILDLRKQVHSLQEELASARAATDSITSGAAASASAVATAAHANARCDALVRERRAVQTIMEQKISVLLQGVSRSASALLTGPTIATASAGQALRKDLDSLERLVGASIAALKNAEKQDNERVRKTEEMTSGVGAYTSGGGVPPAPVASGGGDTNAGNGNGQGPYLSSMSVEQMIAMRKQELLRGNGGAAAADPTSVYAYNGPSSRR